MWGEDGVSWVEYGDPQARVDLAERGLRGLFRKNLTELGPRGATEERRGRTEKRERKQALAW